MSRIDEFEKSGIPVLGEKRGVRMDKKSRTMRSVGGWCIVMGVASIVIGLSVGVGSLVSGGRLLSNANKD